MKISIDEVVRSGVEQAMKDCELTIGMTLKEAVERQIAKKPREAVQTGFFWCPACGREIKMRIEDSKINISYCPFCGQSLDWRETE